MLLDESKNFIENNSFIYNKEIISSPKKITKELMKLHYFESITSKSPIDYLLKGNYCVLLMNLNNILGNDENVIKYRSIIENMNNSSTYDSKTINEYGN